MSLETNLSKAADIFEFERSYKVASEFNPINSFKVAKKSSILSHFDHRINEDFGSSVLSKILEEDNSTCPRRSSEWFDTEYFLRRMVIENEPFKEDEVFKLLQKPLKDSGCTCEKDCLLGKEDPYFPEGINTGLEPSEVIYTGDWYHQGNEGTCMPWSVINAAKALGIDLPVGFATGLLNKALPNKQLGKANGGMYPHELLDYVKDYGSLPLIVSTLMHTNCSLGRVPRILYKDLLKETNDSEMAYQVSEMYSNITKRNASIIKACIDEGSVLRVSITPLCTSWNYRQERELHSVCIPGYRVLGDGTMYVEIVDSSRTKLAGVTVDDFSHHLVPVDAMKISING